MGLLQHCRLQVVTSMALLCMVNAGMHPMGFSRLARGDVREAAVCDFEKGLCYWTQGEDDDFDWVVYGGRLASSRTGPVMDHSPGRARNYLLMNATGHTEGQVAQLVSPEYPAVSATGRCMKFYYHMNGAAMGSLKIYQITDEGRKVVFQRDGDQGMGLLDAALGWHPGRINLESPSPYKLVIEGVVGWAETSYIALDDITLTDTTCPNIPESCGLSASMARTRRILNGEPSSPAQWPWQVLIKVHHEATGKDNQCGGTLITPEWVLTAAHCIEDRTNSRWVTDPKSVRLSFEMNQAEWEQREFSFHPVQMIVHEDRTVPRNGMGPHDLVLLKLPYALTLDEYVNVACLPGATDDVAAGTQCVISGFGREHYKGVSSWELQHAYVNIMDDSVCSNYHGANVFKEDNICAGAPADVAVDACSGDSGGPLVCPKDGAYVLTGVVSFGSRCGFRAYPTPGVYASVAYYRDWITRHIHS